MEILHILLLNTQKSTEQNRGPELDAPNATGGKVFPDNVNEGDDEEKSRGGESDGAFDHREHPVRGVFGGEEDEEHGERYPPLCEVEPRLIDFILHFVGYEGEKEEWDDGEKINHDAIGQIHTLPIFLSPTKFERTNPIQNE